MDALFPAVSTTVPVVPAIQVAASLPKPISPARVPATTMQKLAYISWSLVDPLRFPALARRKRDFLRQELKCKCYSGVHESEVNSKLREYISYIQGGPPPVPCIFNPKETSKKLGYISEQVGYAI